MKHSFASLFAASGLFLAATSAHAQDTEENQDFNRIEACFSTIKHPSAVSAAEKPVPAFQVMMRGSSEKAVCSMHISGTIENSEARNLNMQIFAEVANTQPSVYNMRSKPDNDMAYDIQYGDAHYKATPIESGKDLHRIEISVPTASLIEANDMAFLKDEEAKGNIVTRTEGDITHITVESASVQDWFPEEIMENTLVLMAGSFMAIQRLDENEIDAAAQKSVATSSTVLIPAQP